MKRIYIIAGIMLALTSCSDDVLELTNPNGITTDIYWQTERDVNQALAATYGLFKNVDGGYWGVRGTELTNGRGDDFFIRNDVSYLYQLATFTNTADNGAATSVWVIAYRGIFRANQIIENVPNVPGLTDEQKAQYIAEAKFLRGMNYFNLVINFGDAPVILTVPVTKDQYYTPKSPAADVWAQVKQDFTEAAAGLPVEWTAEFRGRATKGAAIGYLGKSHLYTADWANAQMAFQQLTTAPYNYGLMPNFSDNFLQTSENNQESVFEIQLADVGGTNPWGGENATEALGVTTAQEFAPQEVSGWFEVSFTDKLFNEFQEEQTTTGDFDPRMYATMAWDYPGSTFYNKPFSDFSLLFGYSTLIKKYQNYNQDNELVGTSGAVNYTSSNNERAMRYADVVLMLAEALTQQGNVGDAYQYVNMVRLRAQLDALPTGYTQDQMMAEIRHQRMIEFAREGFRFYDLRRWGLLETEIANSDKQGKQNFNAGMHSYFPTPQSEVDNNPNIN
ncbi:RagB/SusD family nutrient uptake outer membrane protein [Flavobacterium zepuense]|uniref:RagB/SusD family nutrient uptake outer membrane protein n=1 Tax=Flavobacterium zepuense TaxID=2593302 RepID=A0A552V9W1_9FLAO|nr:RagB/SusD family nutrient uptake outer membrane protein [Flavobacterium zepuense]TRW27255.1 RagB/SusD family nutrient uptake outer membrane protein [Flavobacterium zepuense]